MNTRNVSALVAAALLAGCATAPAPQSTGVAAPVAVAPAPTNLTQVYFYAQRGQSQAQQDRDRYECFNWSVQQTGFDPSRRSVPAQHAKPLVPVDNTGPTVVGGTLMGAAIGAAVANPWDRGEGAVIGAIAGTALGALAANAQTSSQASAAQAAQKQVTPARSGYEQQAAGYRRAMSACLEGRGYVVK
jgi:Glycine zipper 2TM domain